MRNSDQPFLANFDNSFVRELPALYVRWAASPSPNPSLVFLNEALAQTLGMDLDFLRSPTGIDVLAGKQGAAGSQPIAQAYAGHQFGGFSPRLGDGRALLLGEILDPQGQRHDLALKGSGPTPFSRRGDGKCALGPALRELLLSEALHCLNIPTTRVLAVLRTGEDIFREGWVPGAMVVRVAASHLRVGTFEYAAAHLGNTAVQQLADYAIARHAPDCQLAENPYLAWLTWVAQQQSKLVAKWLGVGFIHGVMNTDNIAVSGETLDFGPCALLDTYHPRTVFSSIDTAGRYAYGQQAEMLRWNLARLAETLLPLLDPDAERAVACAQAVLSALHTQQQQDWLAVFRAKLGLDALGDPQTDTQLAQDFLRILQQDRLDFTQSFRALHSLLSEERQSTDLNSAAFPEWRARWLARQPQITRMETANPLFIARNHLVEAALSAAVDGDIAPFEKLWTTLQQPFTEQAERADFAQPASREFNAQFQTFCGT